MKLCIYITVVMSVLLSAGCKNNEGMTPLLLAAHSGNDTELTALISDGVRLDETSRYGWTALIFAARMGHDQVVETLLDAGADPNVVSDKISPGFMATRGGYSPTTALHEAIKGQHYSIANTLLDHGANVDSVAVALAAKTGNLPLLERFLNLGVDINQSSYRSPLAEASGAGNLETVQWLIHNGADPNVIAQGSTALREAVYYDQVEIVEYLLKNGANPNLVFSSTKRTALYEAATKYTNRQKYNQNLEVIRILLSYGADTSHKGYGGHTALEHVKIQRTNGLKYIEKADDPTIRKRHENSLARLDAIIDLLEKIV